MLHVPKKGGDGGWDPRDLVEPDRAHRACYADQEVFDLEIERIFHRAWIYAGHESQIPNPGDFATFQIGRQPMIIALRMARSSACSTRARFRRPGAARRAIAAARRSGR